MASRSLQAERTALIVGASRGLGLALAEEFLARAWSVIGTVREGKRTPLHELADQSGGKLRIEAVDINDLSQVERLKAHLPGQFLDLLFVNAGTANANAMRANISDVSTEEFVDVLVTNALSPMRIVDQLADRVRLGGTIGVMSSGQGSIADNERGGNYVYRASKAALNMMMKSFAARTGNDYSLLLLAPGWVQTDLGGPSAPFTIEQVVPALVDTIVAQEGKRGLQYLDRFGKTVRW